MSDNDLDDCEHQRGLLANVAPSDWRNPIPRDRYDLVVIGAGPAGLVAARGAVALGARVALVERDRLGGDCLNTGCVPSKTLIRTARLYADMRDAEHYGVERPSQVRVDFGAAMRRMRRVRERISRNDSAMRLAEEGIDVYLGPARFTGTDTVGVDGATLRFKKALVATGSRPTLPDIPGMPEAGYMTNENVFDLTTRPQSLMVIGGGPLGCEFAQAFARFGIETKIVHQEPFFLPGEERDAAQMVSDALAHDGVEIHLNSTAIKVSKKGEQKLVELVSAGEHTSIAVDQILTGIGRTPNVDDLGLDVAGVDHDPENGIAVDDYMRTTNPRIYAAGDVCLEHKFTDTAEASARIALRNALFPGRKRWSSLTIPWCTYTDPEIAHVGLYVKQANERGIPVRTFTVPMHEVDRAIADGEEEGFAKIHIRDGTDHILGATVVARHAGDMINSVSLAMVSGMGLRTLAEVIHAYPTQAEAIKMAADAYTRTRLTPFVARLSRWWLRR